MNEGEWSSKLGLPGIPAEAEELMVSRDLALARLTGCRIHFQHLSTAGSVELVRAAKAAGLAVTAEATTHHFTLTEAELAGYDPVFKVNPPLRTQADVDAIKAGLADGTIDAIATDHAPHTQDAKELPLDQAPPGMLGLETALALALTELDLPIEQVLALMSWQPAAIAGGMARAIDGRIRRGAELGRHHRPGGHRSRGHLDGRPGPPGQPEPQHALRRTHPHRAGPPHHRERARPVVIDGEVQRAMSEITESHLVLADGTTFAGEAIGAPPTVSAGEVVFNTVLTGYQEVLTDPSYAGQIITFTYPHIGNYGVTPDDDESAGPAARGVIIRDLARRRSNWRSHGRPGRRSCAATTWPASPGSTPAA